MQDECASEIDQVGRQRPLVGDRQHHSTKQLGGMHRDYLLVLLCGTRELTSLPSVFFGTWHTRYLPSAREIHSAKRNSKHILKQ